MTSLPHPFRPVSLSAGDEALELRDIGAADLSPTQDADAFPADDHDDPEYVAAMQQREAARLIGYCDALCLGCGCCLYVPEASRCGDVLCNECQRTGEALAAEADGDDDPTPPSGPHAALAARLRDADLIMAVALGDEEPHCLSLEGADRGSWLSAMTAEILRRIDSRKAA